MGVTTPLAAKNAHNEAQRRQVNLQQTLLNFDTSAQAQVRKAQKVGDTLIGRNIDVVQLKGPTKRA